MKRSNLLLTLLLLSAFAATSTTAETRPDERSNPIRLEGQIREIGNDGEYIVIRLHRDRYPMLAKGHMRVRTPNGRRMDAGELQAGDSIRVDGELYRDFIYVDRITLLLRVERR
ncbi:MAG TPA: hypothetical protein VFT12_12725 [Thermoanaerobaculia bacterium]|nr:hypothetical protein [Thermoanaerobaculia bacterium]